MKNMGRRMLVAAAAAAAALAAAPALADVKAGVDAWQRGDFAAAVQQWRPLADKGDADAQFNMGQAYRLGRGAPMDLRIAQSWFQKAAAQGHEQAQGNLGIMLYESGKRAEAMTWIRRAADRGDPRAQYVLGIELSNGDLLPRDFPRAYALMTRAAAQGLPAAGKAIGEMDKFIPAGDRSKGVVLARQMQQGGSAFASAAPKAGVPVKQVAATLPAGGLAGGPKAQVAAIPRAVPAPAAPAAGGGWRVQLGAYGSSAAAQGQWAVLSKKIPGLAGLQPSYEPAGKLTRLRAGPFAGRAAADRLCASAKAAGQACLPVAP